jgi:signal transduction histidine kinase
LKTFHILALVIVAMLLAFSCDRSPVKKSTKGAIEKYLEKGSDLNLSELTREKNIDSAFSNLADANNDSITRVLYNKTGLYYYQIRKYKKALSVIKKSHRLASEVKDSLSMARALHIAGISYYEQSDKDSAFTAYQNAEKIFQALDSPDLGAVILYKAYIYYDIGEYEMCESEAFKALKKLQNQNLNTEVFNCYNLIATALDGQDNSEEAIKYFELALNKLEKFKDESYTEVEVEQLKSSCYNNIGLVYEKMGKLDDAIAIYNKALNYSSIKSSSPNLYAKLINNLGHAKFKKNDYSGLPTIFFKSLKIRDSLDNIAGEVASRINIGEYYIATGDTLKGIEYLKLAYRDASIIKSSTDMLSSLRKLADADRENSSFYNQRYFHITDSIKDVTKRNHNKFARIEYETQQLEDEKAALDRKNNFIIGLSVIVLLFIAAIFIIYYLNSRNKELLHIQEQQKANEEIYQLMFEQQGKIDNAKAEEKNRIAMELHDGILNNIYAVRLNLEFSNRKTDETAIENRKGFIKELQNVESEIRAVSHDLSRNVAFNQDKNFESILGFMITSQKNKFDTNFEADIDSDIDWEAMPNTHKVNVYRIIQEALQNVNKYSQALNVTVQVKKEDDGLLVAIIDDGVGFDTHIASEGIGLKNLKKRSESLNGKIEIESSIGKGTAIKVHFSL